MNIEIPFTLRLILAVFTCYRLAWMFYADDGAFNILGRFRLWLGKFASKDQGFGLAWTLAELFNCPHCLGVWFAIFILPLVLFPATWSNIILVVGGIAGAQSYLTGRRVE